MQIFQAAEMLLGLKSFNKNEKLQTITTPEADLD